MAGKSSRKPARPRGGGGPSFGGGPPNVAQLMRRAQKMQDEMAAAQTELAEEQVTGTAGGGVVTATMTGSGELLALQIGPAAVDPEDVETLQDLVVAAVRDAARAAAELSEERLGPLSDAAGLPGMPGTPGR